MALVGVQHRLVVRFGGGQRAARGGQGGQAEGAGEDGGVAGGGGFLDRHAGELRAVLRCHLPLAVPVGDLGLEVAGETLRWREGECLVFDDTVEHTAWNLGAGDRTVLLVTFARP